MVIDGANRHDVKLLCATMDGIVSFFRDSLV
jgi:hypothetical protein